MPKPIRLLELDAELPPVEMPGGRVVPVRQGNGFVYDFRSAAMRGEVEDATTLWDAARQCVPTATEDEVKGLSRTQAWGLIAIACGGADAVMDEIERRRQAESPPSAATSAPPDAEGNAEPPAPTTAPPAASDPSTPSDTSS